LYSFISLFAVDQSNLRITNRPHLELKVSLWLICFSKSRYRKKGDDEEGEVCDDDDDDDDDGRSYYSDRSRSLSRTRSSGSSSRSR